MPQPPSDLFSIASQLRDEVIGMLMTSANFTSEDARHRDAMITAKILDFLVKMAIEIDSAVDRNYDK